MMKKLLLYLCASFLLIGCSSKNNSSAVMYGITGKILEKTDDYCKVQIIGNDDNFDTEEIVMIYYQNIDESSVIGDKIIVTYSDFSNSQENKFIKTELIQKLEE